MILRQGIFLLLLSDFNTSHPSQKRETSSVSISKSSQNVINDESPVIFEPASFSPHTASRSYYHLKEVIENSINFHNFHKWRTVSSMIVGSSIPPSPKHVKIKEGEAAPDTKDVGTQTVNISQSNSFISNGSNLKTIKVFDDGSVNGQVDPHETPITKSIKSSVETVPAVSKRAIDFKLPKWNFGGWRGWNGRKGTNQRIDGATSGIQRAQSMQNFQGTPGTPPGQTSQSSMPNNRVNINNKRIASSRLKSGVRVGRVRKAGRKGTRVSQRNKAKVVKSNSPDVLPAATSDKSTVSNAPVRVASGKENSKRPIFDSDDSQTEGYSRNSNSRSKDRFHNPPGFSDFSDFQSEAIPRTHNKGKKNRKPITPTFKAKDYYSSGDSGKSDSSSFSNPKKAKSVKARLRKKIKPSTTNSNPPETKSVKPENKISPVFIPSSGDEKSTVSDSGTKAHSTPASIPDKDKVQYIDHNGELPNGETGMSDSEGRLMSNHNQPSNSHNFHRPQSDDDMDMHNYQMGGRGGGGDNYGKSSGQNIGEAIGNILPIAHTIGNVIIGKGDMGHGAGGYGGGGYGRSYDHMDDTGGYGGGGGMSGYGGGGGMSGYGGGGGMSAYGNRGYGASGLGHGGGNFGASDHGGDPYDTHDLLDEGRSKVMEKSTSKNASRNKNEPELDTEKHQEEDENDNHDKNTENTGEKPVQNSRSKDTHNKISNNPSKNHTIDKKKKNDIITTDNAKPPNATVSRSDV